MLLRMPTCLPRNPIAPRRSLDAARGATLTLLAFIGAAACGEEAKGPDVTFKVMTRNLYLGADLLDVVMSPTPAEVPERLAKLWATMLKSDIPARAKLLAAEIAEEKPDLVGLQEVELFRTQTPSDFKFGQALVTNASDVRFDFLALLRAELDTLDARYVVAVEAPFTDAELPGALEAGALSDVRMTDRDVILVREGLAISKARHMPYSTFIPLPLGGPMGVTIPMRRGVGLVDVTHQGASFTFLNTHLEVGGGPASPFQESQANDLKKLLGATPGPLVAVGDFNSPPGGRGTKSYGLLAEVLADVWTKLHPTVDGFTCCTNLLEETRKDRERIDLVFTRGAVSAIEAHVVGIDPARRAPGGQWPSDHAGVVATIGVASKAP
jgi:endonuclease/exonuclease/phosphatase family metal-dependent hydrolase